MKVCVERIIPDHLDPLREKLHHTRAALKLFSEVKYGLPLNTKDIVHINRMALINVKKWDNGTVLKCKFLDGSSYMRKKVEEKAHQWEEFANIKFDFVNSGPAEIRISFYADAGSWSTLGKDALVEEFVPLYQPTMNYGWLRDDTPDLEYNRVVVHEFGHALACIHEHQSPRFDRKWNIDVVNQVFKGPPNFWDDDGILNNVLEKYSPDGIEATNFDPESIMLYAFDGELFSDGLGPTNMNSVLSEKDKEMIRLMYPR